MGGVTHKKVERAKISFIVLSFFCLATNVCVSPIVFIPPNWWVKYNCLYFSFIIFFSCYKSLFMHKFLLHTYFYMAKVVVCQVFALFINFPSLFSPSTICQLLIAYSSICLSGSSNTFDDSSSLPAMPLIEPNSAEMFS